MQPFDRGHGGPMAGWFGSPTSSCASFARLRKAWRPTSQLCSLSDAGNIVPSGERNSRNARHERLAAKGRGRVRLDQMAPILRNASFSHGWPIICQRSGTKSNEPLLPPQNRRPETLPQSSDEPPDPIDWPSCCSRFSNSSFLAMSRAARSRSTSVWRVHNSSIDMFSNCSRYSMNFQVEPVWGVLGAKSLGDFLS